MLFLISEQFALDCKGQTGKIFQPRDGRCYSSLQQFFPIKGIVRQDLCETKLEPGHLVCFDTLTGSSF